MPFVSVILVNYNGRRFLDECLTALAAQTYPRALAEIILVDNGSHDDSVAHVRACYPWVRIVELGYNAGFAAGNRAGLRRAHGDAIVLLNNDTIVAPDWLAELVAASEGEGIGGVGSKIVYRDRPDTLNSTGSILHADGHGSDRGCDQPDDGRFDDASEVFGASGCAVLLKRAMLDDVGFFDRRLFMYYEDVDLCWRARRRGWKFAYAPRAVVRHVHCGSSGEWSPFFTYYVERNRAAVSIKNAPFIVAVWVACSYVQRAVKACVTALRGGSWPRAEAYLRGVGSLLGNLPRLILERWQLAERDRVGPAELSRQLSPRPVMEPTHARRR